MNYEWWMTREIVLDSHFYCDCLRLLLSLSGQPLSVPFPSKMFVSCSYPWTRLIPQQRSGFIFVSMGTFVKHPAMACVHESYLRGSVFANSFPRTPTCHNMPLMQLSPFKFTKIILLSYEDHQIIYYKSWNSTIIQKIIIPAPLFQALTSSPLTRLLSSYSNQKVDRANPPNRTTLFLPQQ